MASRFEQLIEANDDATPEELFLTAVGETLELRRSSRIEKLVRQVGFSLPASAIGQLESLRYTVTITPFKEAG